MTVRTRTLAGGRVRHDVRYRDANGRTVTRHGFTNRQDAEAFQALARWAIRRWPLAPLLERTGKDLGELAELAGLDGSDPSLHFARRDGLTDTQADTLATRAGWHPVEVWGWAWVTAGLAFGPLDPAGPDPVPDPITDLFSDPDRVELHEEAS